MGNVVSGQIRREGEEAATGPPEDLAPDTIIKRLHISASNGTKATSWTFEYPDPAAPPTIQHTGQLDFELPASDGPLLLSSLLPRFHLPPGGSEEKAGATKASISASADVHVCFDISIPPIDEDTPHPHPSLYIVNVSDPADLEGLSNIPPAEFLSTIGRYSHSLLHPLPPPSMPTTTSSYRWRWQPPLPPRTPSSIPVALSTNHSALFLLPSTPITSPALLSPPVHLMSADTSLDGSSIGESPSSSTSDLTLGHSTSHLSPSLHIHTHATPPKSTRLLLSASYALVHPAFQTGGIPVPPLRPKISIPQPHLQLTSPTTSAPASPTSPLAQTITAAMATANAPITPSRSSAPLPADGPVFRAELAHMERQAALLKDATKQSLRAAHALIPALQGAARAEAALYASFSHLTSLLLAEADDGLARDMVLYMDRVSTTVLGEGERRAHEITTLLLEPLRLLYDRDIRPLPLHTRQFGQESDAYYALLDRYLRKRRKGSTIRSEGLAEGVEGMSGGADVIPPLSPNHASNSDPNMNPDGNLAPISPTTITQPTSASGIKAERQKERLATFELARSSYYARLRGILHVAEGATSQSLLHALALHARKDRDHHLRASGTDEALQALEEGLSIILQRRLRGEEDGFTHGIAEEEEEWDAPGKEGLLYVRDATNEGLGGETSHLVSQIVSSSGMNLSTTWQERWVVVSEGKLYEHEMRRGKKRSSMTSSAVQARCVIPLHLAHVRSGVGRGGDKKGRRFTFEVQSPSLLHRYQASSDAEAEGWVRFIRAAIARAIAALSPIGEGTNGSDGHREISLPPTHSTPTKDTPRVIDQVWAHTPNRACAECLAPDPTWCSVNLGITLCIECSGIHRHLGTHISKVRSLELDDQVFSPSVLALLVEHLGNERAASVWEATRDEAVHGPRIRPGDGREAKDAWVRRKYIEKAWVRPLAADVGETLDADGALFVRGILDSDAGEVLRSLALGADPSTWRDAERLGAWARGRGVVKSLGVVESLGKRYLYQSPLSLALFHASEERGGEREEAEHDTSMVLPVVELLLLNGADPGLPEPVSGMTLVQFLESAGPSMSVFIPYLQKRRH